MSADRLEQTDSSLLDAVRTVRWPARRRSPLGLAGSHLSKILGASAEFTEYRAYRQGDETRRIDWKLFARSNRAYIKLSNERTVLPTMFLIDASASLAYPAQTREKWHYARQIVLGLAASAHGSGDPVGLLMRGADGMRHLPPRTRQGVVYEIARMLASVEPAGSEPLAPLLAMLRSAGRVAIVSDFLGDAEQMRAIASQFAAAGREVHAIHVLHADELDPPQDQALLADPEDLSIKRPITSTTRRAYLRTFGAWREELARSWRMAGTYFTTVSTVEPVARAVRRIAMPQVVQTAGR